MASWKILELNYTAISEDFCRPKAKIDFITISIPKELSEGSPDDVARFEKVISGRIECPKRWRDNQRDGWLTIHDPSTKDLAYLAERYPETTIRTIEVALDFRLRDGSNDPERLHSLYSYLKTNLYPQKHQKMREQKARRKYYDYATRTIEKDTLNSKSEGGSIYWTTQQGYEQTRLYVKHQDNGRPVEHHSVRLEVTLLGGGVQDAEAFKCGLLPHFSQRFRKYMSPFFSVAKAVKPPVIRTRSKKPEAINATVKANAKTAAKAASRFARYGAAWAVKHGYSVTPDTDMTGLIGEALKGLRASLQRGFAPNFAGEYAFWVEKTLLIFKTLESVETHHYRSSTGVAAVSPHSERSERSTDSDRELIDDSQTIPSLYRRLASSPYPQCLAALLKGKHNRFATEVRTTCDTKANSMSVFKCYRRVGSLRKKLNA